MDLLSFNYSIIKNLDKNLAKRIVSIEKKFAKLTFKNEEIALNLFHKSKNVHLFVHYSTCKI